MLAHVLLTAGTMRYSILVSLVLTGLATLSACGGDVEQPKSPDNSAASERAAEHADDSAQRAEDKAEKAADKANEAADEAKKANDK